VRLAQAQFIYEMNPPYSKGNNGTYEDLNGVTDSQTFSGSFPNEGKLTSYQWITSFLVGWGSVSGWAYVGDDFTITRSDLYGIEFSYSYYGEYQVASNFGIGGASSARVWLKFISEVWDGDTLVDYYEEKIIDKQSNAGFGNKYEVLAGSRVWTRDVNLETGKTYTWYAKIEALATSFATVDSVGVARIALFPLLDHPDYGVVIPRVKIIYPSALTWSLSNGYVNPSSGTTSTTFNYFVTYEHDYDVAPTISRVWIDGSPYGMSLYSGSPFSGTYRYQTTLSLDSHNYYFEFSDGVSTAKLPSSGSYIGPTVSSSSIPPPSNLVASAVSTSQINLVWIDNSADESDFHIYRKTGSSGSWTEIDTVSANVQSY